MSDTPFGAQTLAATAQLLLSGGDARIRRDPVTGLSMYGCSALPDPTLIALGSCTASTISEAGMAAADALRELCLSELQTERAGVVYARQVQRLRATLLALCGFSDTDNVDAIPAASGTDLFLLAGQCLKPDCTVMIALRETGSGMASALQGQHFNSRTALRQTVTIGSQVSGWHGELLTVDAREPDGSVRSRAAVDDECIRLVSAAASAGKRVLLILTDTSKTSLIIPGVGTALSLKQRWPAQVEVLVDACQFRISTATIRAYVEQGCMVALTGSKFLAGPTFSGALLIPQPTAARYRDVSPGPGAGAYSSAADWPCNWLAGRSLPASSNFGLLLRWEAALSHLRGVVALPGPEVCAFMQLFGQTIGAGLAAMPCLEALPVATLTRGPLNHAGDWDTAQSIFPFLLLAPGGLRPLQRHETEQVYRALRLADASRPGCRFQLGQPVACGTRDGIDVSALRLCISAPMLVAACTKSEGAAASLILQALVTLDRVGELVAAGCRAHHDDL